jgi:hypothetical protein
MNLRPIAAGLVAVALLTGCGGGRNESASQPAVVAQKPAENPPAAVPAVETAPAASGAKPAAVVTSTAPAAAKTTDPPFTPGTSLPGAIPPSPAVEVKSEKPVDPLVWLQQQESRRADYKKRLAEAEASAQVAEVSVADWQRTILAFKNPFLPRPQLSAEDQQTIEGKDGIFRVNWAEGKLAAATAVRDAARKTVDDLKANPPTN